MYNRFSIVEFKSAGSAAEFNKKLKPHQANMFEFSTTNLMKMPHFVQVSKRGRKRKHPIDESQAKMTIKSTELFLNRTEWFNYDSNNQQITTTATTTTIQQQQSIINGSGNIQANTTNTTCTTNSTIPNTNHTTNSSTCTTTTNSTNTTTHTSAAAAANNATCCEQAKKKVKHLDNQIATCMQQTKPSSVVSVHAPSNQDHSTITLTNIQQSSSNYGKDVDLPKNDNVPISAASAYTTLLESSHMRSHSYMPHISLIGNKINLGENAQLIVALITTSANNKQAQITQSNLITNDVINNQCPPPVVVAAQGDACNPLNKESTTTTIGNNPSANNSHQHCNLVSSTSTTQLLPQESLPPLINPNNSEKQTTTKSNNKPTRTSISIRELLN